jgi:predicted nucleic acid-binding protein
VVGEYLEVLERLGVAATRTRRLKERIESRETVTYIRLGGHPTESRDPDDNLMLATAAAGKAKFLITNDRESLRYDGSV